MHRGTRDKAYTSLDAHFYQIIAAREVECCYLSIRGRNGPEGPASETTLRRSGLRRGDLQLVPHSTNSNRSSRAAARKIDEHPTYQV